MVFDNWPHEVIALVRQAQERINKGTNIDLMSACDALYDALDLIPDDPVLLITLGKVFQQNGNSEAASIQFKKAINLAPDYILTLLQSIDLKMLLPDSSLTSLEPSSTLSDAAVVSKIDFQANQIADKNPTLLAEPIIFMSKENLSGEVLLTQSKVNPLIITVAFWNNFNELVNASPVHCLAASSRAVGFKGEFVLLINDAEKLPANYIQLLTSLGVQIVTVEKMLQLINASFPSLNEFSFLEKFSFIRWAFIKKYLEGYSQLRKDILVVDSDILFFVNPSQLKEAFSEKNFVAQSSPAFTYLSNPLEWLNQYLAGLFQFSNDRDGFSENIIRNVNELQNKPEAAGLLKNQLASDYSTPLSSDKDLINVLIENQLLMQDNVTDSLRSFKLAMNSNPLFFTNGLQDIIGNLPATLKIKSEFPSPSTISINDLRFFHFHFHNTFVKYCTATLEYLKNQTAGALQPHAGVFNSALKSFSWKPSAPRRIAPQSDTHITSNKNNSSGHDLSRVQLYKHIHEFQSLIYYGFLVSNTPRLLMDIYFQLIPASFFLKDIFNPETWWDTNIKFSLEA